MSIDTDKERKPVAIVFGGRSPIAISCATSLAKTQQVFLITRTIDDAVQNEIGHVPAITLVEADLEKVGAADSLILKIYDQGFEPTAVAFLQRYRPSGEPSFENHSRVELWAVAEALEAIKRFKHRTAEVNVILSSSPAAHKVVDDRDLAYHVVKAGQEALARFYGAQLQRDGVCVNAVRIGSLVIKERARNYWESIPHVVKGMSALSPAGHILTSSEVGSRLAGFLSPHMSGLSGQVFTVDGGYSLLDGSQLARSALDLKAEEGAQSLG